MLGPGFEVARHVLDVGHPITESDGVIARRWIRTAFPRVERPSRHRSLAEHRDNPGDDIWVHGRPTPRPIEVADYDPSWPARYEVVAERVRAALGVRVLGLQHVGSTSVPGLPAKPIIDVDLTVAEAADEPAYLPDLEAAGFELVIREPAWHEHRALKHTDPDTNLHVFGRECPEVARQRLFRDWLIEHPDDLARYRDAKLRAATHTTASGGIVTDYNRHKEPIIREIYDKIFKDRGLL
ncbi:GrpB family protein [Ruania sp. N2-46]|uniref:GrpB family protein n=2 Tax=Occultella gossypii TaxID=2800820 RepID=A0ABS7SG06_9MICO|nr:GrpB family protein [Occultella gossypii]